MYLITFHFGPRWTKTLGTSGLNIYLLEGCVAIAPRIKQEQDTVVVIEQVWTNLLMQEPHWGFEVARRVEQVAVWGISNT